LLFFKDVESAQGKSQMHPRIMSLQMKIQ